MAATVQFVNAISATPTVRVDLNSRTAGLMIAKEGIDLSPPPLRRIVVSTVMTDGEHIPASAYGNRTLKIPLVIVPAATEAAAATLQNLARELARPTNLLKLQLDGAGAPVFFRTFAAPDYTLSMLRLLLARKTEITLEIQAEPFALGLKETLSPVTVTEDPASGTNRMCWDITGVKGDVETPLMLTLPAGNLYDAGDPISVLAVRRRGTPGNVPFVLQAEAMTLATDTTLPGTDATMSGSGSSYARTSFSTTSTWARRIYLDTYPTTPSVDARGRYRVFACVRRSSATGTINMQLGYADASTPIRNAGFTTEQTTSRVHIDLGLITFPQGADPGFDGYSGVDLPVKGSYLEVRAERPSGTSNLDVDYLLFVPADDNLALIDWGSAASTSDEFVVDGTNEVIYTQTTSDEVYGSRPTQLGGGFPTVTPGVTNRIYWVRRTGRSAAVTKTETTVITCAYFPRYLFVRPATT